MLSRPIPRSRERRWIDNEFESRTVASKRAVGSSRFGNVGVISAQAYVFAFMPLGFDAFELPPQKALALTLLTLGAVVGLGPRGSASRIRFSVAGLLFYTWWLLSGLWAELNWAWRAETNKWFSLTIGMVACASLLPLDKFFKALLWGYYFNLGYQWFFCLSRGSARIHDTGLPGWHGTFIHKNELAACLLVGIITIWKFEKNHLISYGAQAMSLALLVLSRSSTGYAVVAVLLVAWLWLNHHERQAGTVGFTFFITLMSMIGLLAAMFQFMLPQITRALGKDETLSTRTELWRNVYYAIRDRPLRGYGPGVWLDQGREPILTINQPLGAVAFHAHNGFLNLWFLLGIGGLVLYFSWFAMTFVSAWRRLENNARLAHWAILLSIFMFVFSFAESTTLAQWMVIIATTQTLLSRVPKSHMTRSVARARRSRRVVQRETGLRRSAS